MSPKPIIEFKAVSFSYPHGRCLFNNVSYAFQEGGFYLITGPSGMGKSSLLRLMNRLEEPTGGKILFKNQTLTSYEPPFLRRAVLYMQQSPTVIDGSVKENLLLPFTFKHNRSLVEPDEARLKQYLRDLGLVEIPLSAPAANLSLGQLQRLCLIRGLLLDPDVVLLDEPTSALDGKSSRMVAAMVERFCLSSSKTVIMVSHQAFQPEKVTPQEIRIEDGRFETMT